MGFENRDYTREGDYTGTLSGWGLDYLSPVVKWLIVAWLIVANAVVFVLQIFLFGRKGISREKGDKSNYWGLIPFSFPRGLAPCP